MRFSSFGAVSFGQPEKVDLRLREAEFGTLLLRHDGRIRGAPSDEGGTGAVRPIDAVLCI
jgi:hypothetical protein